MPLLPHDRIERTHVAELQIAEHRDQRQRDRDPQRRPDRCAASRGGGRHFGRLLLHVLEQALLDFLPRLEVLRLAERSVGVLALELRQLVAVERDVGGVAVRACARPAAAKQRRQHDQQRDCDEQGRDEPEHGHARSSFACSNACALARCSSLSPDCSTLPRRLRM